MMSRIGTIALLAMVGTLFVLFFPAACGPFTVTNGPATAFRAVAAVQALLMLLCSSLLIALLQLPACSMTVTPVLPGCDGNDLGPFSLRC
jgi:hypothetical protein